MRTLQIRLFGHVEAAHDGGAANLKITPTAQTLLAYLLLHPTFTSRDALACLCWCDRPEAQARSCLNTALWRLRSTLEPDGVTRGTYLRTTPTGEVSFNWDSDHWLDAATFEKCATCILSGPIEGLRAEQVHQLEEILPLYRGDLLEGFYEDWAVRERERMRELYLNSLTRLLRYHRQRGDLERSLHYAQEVLRLDPLHEEIHREAMRLYAANGQRTLAIRQYERCRQVLADEMAIPPMPETQALYRQIIGEGSSATSAASPEPEPTTLAEAVRLLQAAVHDFTSAQGQLQRAIELVERLTGFRPR